MQTLILEVRKLYFVAFLLVLGISTAAQSYLVGPVDPSVGTSANYTTHNHYNLFDVLNSSGIYIDSLTIYPATASSTYTIVVQNSAQQQIASYTGVSTVANNLPERIKVNLFVPMGSGYRIGLTTGSVGMLRNATGISFPYTVPNVISLTGATFGTTYWYFFYQWRVSLPVFATDAGLSSLVSPADSVCSGNQPISVMLKNHGPSTLTTTTINWSVNNVAQSAYNWVGNLPASDSTLVNIGLYNFLPGTAYAIQGYTQNPNSVADTINHNDTISRTGIFVKTAPSASCSVTNFDICEGDTLPVYFTLTGSPPWSLTLQSGTTTMQFTNILNPNYTAELTPNMSATYTVTSVSDASGCTIDPAISIVVNVFPAPPSVITSQGGNSACSGDSLVLLGSVGLNFSYQWLKDGILQSGPFSYTYTAKESGSYTLIVTSSIGCSATSVPMVLNFHPNPTVTLGNDTAILPGQTVSLNAGAGFNSYLWSTGATTQTINASSATVGVIPYWVQVTDNNGCKGGDTIKINFTNHPGIAKFSKSPGFSIAPNPASDLVEVHWDAMANEPVSLTIFTIDGRKVVQKNLNPSDGKALLDVSALPAGNYLIQLSSLTNRTIQRLVIVR